MSGSTVKIGGKSVSLSNLDKPLYPTGFTKAQVIDYYANIAPVMLPHLKGRPVSFKRYPNGTQAPFFFQKNRPEHAPAWVKSVKVRGRDGKEIDYCLIDSLPALIWAANSAALELHVPLARATTAARPDFIVFDLDPGPGATLLDCARLALRLREHLDALDLNCFVKTSGSKGLHVLVPLNTGGTFEKTREFAKDVAKHLEQEDPEHVTATMAKHQRTGKIFVDWNQNEQTQTTVCAYSLRATAEPGVSTPLTWAEIEEAVKRKKMERLIFSPAAVLKRVERDGDLLAPILTLKQRLPKTPPTNRAERPPAPSPLYAGKRVGVSSQAKNGAKRHPAVPPLTLALSPAYGGDGAGAGSRSTPAARLKPYRAKRDFTSSPEPSGQSAAKPNRAKRAKKAPIFCVQKHDASHLHYDFRLEHRGVLLSWAVPKGPSLRPTDKRLAMRVEDHPLDYANFEGVIPQGYGAGVVMLWDHGQWQPQVEDVDEALEKGELKFSLDGVKLKGSWVLVRTHGRGREDGRSWLLIKHRDEWAGDIDITQAAPLSVKSFKDMSAIEAAEKRRGRRVAT